MKDSNPWWRETSIYQVYPRSFADSNGDGIGDIPGIISKLDYIKDLGFETVWLSPHYASPQRDFGYDITDYRNVAPEYGSFDDALKLIREVHQRGMKIIFDMILNHTSDEHPWFIESRSNRDNPKRDWYIWRNGNGQRPPNNWSAIPGGSGWQHDSKTGDWYYHSFLPFQPDLNYRNPEVKAAMFDTLRFWLDHGVDGFRLDIFHSVYKDELFRNNPFSWRFIPTPDQREGYFQKFQYTLNRPETFQLAKEVRALIEGYRPARFVLGEVFGERVVKDYLGEKADGLNLILLFDLIHLRQWSSEKLKAILRAYEAEYPEPFLPTYSLGNHDRRRYFSRMNKQADLARLLALFIYTARGIPINYYGDELGLPDGDFAHRNALDSMARPYWWVPGAAARRLNLYINRDGCRTPMQWDDSANAGFSGAQPWLPVHANYRSCNVKAQRLEEFSILNVHRDLLRLRNQSPCLRRGSVCVLPDGELPPGVVGYDRRLGREVMRVLLNFSRKAQTIVLPSTLNKVLVRTDAGCSLSGGKLSLGRSGGVVIGSASLSGEG